MASRSIIGIDVGGTKIAARRYNAASWDIEAEERIGTSHGRTFETVIEQISELISRLRTAEIIGVGIGLPGLIKRPEGTIVTLPNIKGAKGHDLVHDLASIHLPIVIENDSNCFALAEALHGAGNNHSVVLGITMGTGVGGGIIVNGNIFHGSHGFAGEIGHMLLQPGNPPGGSPDTRGEVEQFLSGTALKRRCKEADDPDDLLSGVVCDFLHPQIHEEVAWLCASLSHMLDPSIIILGGSTGKALGSHLPRIQEELKKWMLPGAPIPELAIASLKDAGTRGAALCAMKELRNKNLELWHVREKERD